MFDWQAMFIGDLNWKMAAEVALRALILFGYTVALFRIVLGKRSISELTPYEFIILIALGGAITDPMLYLDLPFLQAMLVITLLVVVDRLLVELTNRIRPLEFALEGRPGRLVIDGRVDYPGMRQAALSRDELFAALRMLGVAHLGQVKRAYMEMNGKISLFLYPEAEVRPGLPILPPNELEEDEDSLGPESHERAAMQVCSECGLPAGEAEGGEWECAQCGSREREPAVTGIKEVAGPGG